jgi:hypothetical protein
MYDLPIIGLRYPEFLTDFLALFIKEVLKGDGRSPMVRKIGHTGIHSLHKVRIVPKFPVSMPIYIIRLRIGPAAIGHKKRTYGLGYFLFLDFLCNPLFFGPSPVMVHNFVVQYGKQPGLGRTLVVESLFSLSGGKKGVLHQIFRDFLGTGFVVCPTVKVIGIGLKPFDQLMVHFIVIVSEGSLQQSQKEPKHFFGP